MRIEHDFSVPVPVDVAWQVLLDVERIAPCMPGASLTGIDGDRFTGKVAVRLGPVSLTYQGSGRFVTRDEQRRLVVIEASGQDRRGAGTAAATVTATLRPDEGSTQVDVVTDLNITGRAAQYGRGMIADVSAKLTGQFADCLARHLAENPPGAEGAAVPDTPSATPGAGPGASGAEPREAAVDQPGPATARPGPGTAAPAEPGRPRSAPPTPATLPTPSPGPGDAPAPTVLPGGAARPEGAAGPEPELRPRPTPPSRAGAQGPETPAGPGPLVADDVPAVVDAGGYRRVDQPEPEPVDLLGVVGVPDRLRRLAPYLVGALAGGLLVWLAMRRRAG